MSMSATTKNVCVLAEVVNWGGPTGWDLLIAVWAVVAHTQKAADTSDSQVFRYSALAFGVFYGFTHQRKITATQRAEAAKREYEHKEQLIAKAKEEFARKKTPGLHAAGDGGMSVSYRGGGLAVPFNLMFPVELQLVATEGHLLMLGLVVRDPMDPKFDMEAYFNTVMKENP
jgi:F-type H+-transporting ATP synthase subunit e